MHLCSAPLSLERQEGPGSRKGMKRVDEEGNEGKRGEGKGNGREEGGGERRRGGGGKEREKKQKKGKGDKGNERECGLREGKLKGRVMLSN